MHQKVVIQTTYKRDDALIVATVERYVDRGPRIVRNPLTGLRIGAKRPRATGKRTERSNQTIEDQITSLLEKCR